MEFYRFIKISWIHTNVDYNQVIIIKYHLLHVVSKWYTATHQFVSSV